MEVWREHEQFDGSSTALPAAVGVFPTRVPTRARAGDSFGADGRRRARSAAARPSESADLLTHATLTRARQPTSWEVRHHPGLWVWVRVLIGIWLVILTGILCQDGYWWGLALLAPAALHFYLALRLGRSIDSQREAGGPSPAP